MATQAANAVRIQQLIRRGNAKGWQVVRKGKSYPATKCLDCGAPSVLQFERNGEKLHVCFACNGWDK